MLAAVMNAMLTWWGVSIAILNHETLGNAVVARATLLKVVPIFVAVMVWLIRVLIIGTISMAGDRLFSQGQISTTTRKSKSSRRVNNPSTRRKHQRSIQPFNNSRSPTVRRGLNASSYQPAPKPASPYRSQSNPSQEPQYTPVEQTYSSVSFSGNRSQNQSNQTRF
jgi:hypothetical protein